LIIEKNGGKFVENGKNVNLLENLISRKTKMKEKFRDCIKMKIINLDKTHGVEAVQED
jgi:hypothetical protein